MIEKLGAACVCLYLHLCVHLCAFMCLCECLFVCVALSDREQGLGLPSDCGSGGEKSVQDSFFLIWYRGKGGEAGALFFLALALPALSGY